MALRLLKEPAQAPDELPAALLAAVADGDDGACRRFVSCYERRVFTLCVRMLGDVHAAEDAAQETFWRAMRAAAGFDPHGPARLSTWVLTIATRQCLDELRRRRRHPDRPSDEDVAELVSPLRPDALLDAAAEEARVMRALDVLDADQRAVVVLRVLLERSVDETAQSLAIEAGTVKSRLSRAKARMAKAFSGGTDVH
jgi:RNA polymerase sigma-70 factor (ECF subfamily)